MNAFDLTAIHQLIRSRRSVRRFLSDPIPTGVLSRILETAIWAPSAHNRQPWRFVVMNSIESRKRLATAMAADFRAALLAEGVEPDAAESRVFRSRARIESAPTAVLLCLDHSVLDHYQEPVRDAGERIMGVQSVALAGGTLLLAAHAEGLGGVWVCAPLFVPSAVRTALGLPGHWEPQGLLLLGYPAVVPDPGNRRPVDDVTIYL